MSYPASTEQQLDIKFLVKLRKSSQEITDKLRAVYGDNALQKTSVFKWIKHFKDGGKDVQDYSRPQQPLTFYVLNTNPVRFLVLADCGKIVCMIPNELDGKSTIHTILTEHLGLKKLGSRMVPELLMVDQKLKRVPCVADWKNSVENDGGFLNRVITGDDSWFYNYDLEIKSQSKEWKGKKLALNK